MTFGLNSYDMSVYESILKNIRNLGFNFTEVYNENFRKWYIDCPDLSPENILLLNTEIITKRDSYDSISKVTPLDKQTEAKYKRYLSNSMGSGALNLCKNDAMEFFDGSDRYVFLSLQREQAQKLSRDIGRLYYFGKYINRNEYRLYLSNSKYLENFVQKNQIIMESSNIFDLEKSINYFVFNSHFRLRKYAYSPYFDSGQYFAPKIHSDFLKKF